MTRHFTRRRFLARSAAATVGIWATSNFALGSKGESPNNKLNLGIIGTANRAAANIAGIKSEHIVALCDIDENYLAAATREFPSARTYCDFRELLEQPGLDAV